LILLGFDEVAGLANRSGKEAKMKNFCPYQGNKQMGILRESK
jgi:hypothetical protein